MSYFYLALVLGAFLAFSVTLAYAMWWTRGSRPMNPNVSGLPHAEDAHDAPKVRKAA